RRIDMAGDSGVAVGRHLDRVGVRGRTPLHDRELADACAFDGERRTVEELDIVDSGRASSREPHLAPGLQHRRDVPAPRRTRFTRVSPESGDVKGEGAVVDLGPRRGHTAPDEFDGAYLPRAWPGQPASQRTPAESDVDGLDLNAAKDEAERGMQMPRHGEQISVCELPDARHTGRTAAAHPSHGTLDGQPDRLDAQEGIPYLADTTIGTD